MKYILLLVFFISCNLLEGKTEDDIQSYLLAEQDPLQEILDALFISPKVLSSKKELEKMGFEIIEIRHPSFFIAKHPLLPRYVVKAHLNSSTRSQEDRWNNLLNRCYGAEAIEKIIAFHKLRYFVVPKKKIYVTRDGDPILLATYIELASKADSKYAWKTIAKKEHIQELYQILRHGYGSSKLPENLSFTKKGTFACIDTEKPPREDIPMHTKKHLSKKMQRYFQKLVMEGDDL